MTDDEELHRLALDYRTAQTYPDTHKAWLALKAYVASIAAPALRPAPVAVPSDERAAFEAWAGDQGFPLQYTVRGDEYRDMRTQGPWEAWQARAVLALAPKPSSATVPSEFPPLPEARIESYQIDSTMRTTTLHTYSAEDMREYARSAVLALAAPAVQASGFSDEMINSGLVDELGRQHEAAQDESPEDEANRNAADELADAIRASVRRKS